MRRVVYKREHGKVPNDALAWVPCHHCGVSAWSVGIALVTSVFEVHSGHPRFLNNGRRHCGILRHQSLDRDVFPDTVSQTLSLDRHNYQTSVCALSSCFREAQRVVLANCGRKFRPLESSPHTSENSQRRCAGRLQPIIDRQSHGWHREARSSAHNTHGCVLALNGINHEACCILIWIYHLVIKGAQVPSVVHRSQWRLPRTRCCLLHNHPGAVHIYPYEAACTPSVWYRCVSRVRAITAAMYQP